MSDFNDWCERQDIFNGNVDNQDCQWALKFMRQSFEAGQQSQQTKIDELQSRVDEALTLIYTEKSKVECDIYKGMDADLIIGLGYELHLILKGNKDEN